MTQLLCTNQTPWDSWENLPSRPWNPTQSCKFSHVLKLEFDWLTQLPGGQTYYLLGWHNHLCSFEVWKPIFFIVVIHLHSMWPSFVHSLCYIILSKTTRPLDSNRLGSQNQKWRGYWLWWPLFLNGMSLVDHDFVLVVQCHFRATVLVITESLPGPLVGQKARLTASCAPPVNAYCCNPLCPTGVWALPTSVEVYDVVHKRS